MRKPLSLRSLVSLSIATCMLAMFGTGLLMFFMKHSRTTAAIHTSFGIIVFVVAVLHARNNWKPLRGYGYRPLLISVVPALLLLGGLVYEAPGLSAVYDWGNEWRSQQENKEESRIVYQSLATNAAARGIALELDARKGKTFDYPLFAVWIEDLQGKFLQTLYVSKVIGTSVFQAGREENGEWVPDVVRRPEALPYWGHRRGIRAKDGYFLPDASTQVPDVLTGATPTESFRLRTRTDDPLTAFRIYLEVNQSFDWNDYFSKTRFPDDAIYSGSGANGQPSVVYAAAIDLSQPITHYALNVVGHGHPGGHNGELEVDLSRMTTALEILDGVTIKIIR
jgi:hypothetical protein